MKVTLSILLTLFALAGCEGPRSQTKYISSPQYGSYDSYKSGISVDGSVSVASDGTTTTTSTIPTDAKHCKFITATNSFPSSTTTTHLNGGFVVCQSSTDETKVYVQLESAMSNYRLCIVPATVGTTIGTQYLGDPTCEFVPEERKVYVFTLVKNRPSATINKKVVTFSGYKINSVFMATTEEYPFASPFVGSQEAIVALLTCFRKLPTTQTYCTSVNSANQFVFSKLQQSSSSTYSL